MSLTVQIVNGPLRDPPPPLSADGGGAVVCFEGVVRPREAGATLVAIDYESYEPMASTQLRTLAEEIHDRFRLLGVSVEHSVGSVPVGERSFRLRIASRHRKEALAAMDHFIDRMKRDVPIWKRTVCASATPRKAREESAS